MSHATDISGTGPKCYPKGDHHNHLYKVRIDTAMQVNFLGLLAFILVVFIPSIFLVILYVQTASRNDS